MLAPMSAIFTHYGSWLVTGLMLAISMVTLAMLIAIQVGAEPIQVTEENNLLEFAITSGELVIQRLLRKFQLLFVTEVNGN